MLGYRVNSPTIPISQEKEEKKIKFRTMSLISGNISLRHQRQFGPAKVVASAQLWSPDFNPKAPQTSHPEPWAVSMPKRLHALFFRIRPPSCVTHAWRKHQPQALRQGPALESH